MRACVYVCLYVSIYIYMCVCEQRPLPVSRPTSRCSVTSATTSFRSTCRPFWSWRCRGCPSGWTWTPSRRACRWVCSPCSPSTLTAPPSRHRFLRSPPLSSCLSGFSSCKHLSPLPYLHEWNTTKAPTDTWYNQHDTTGNATSTREILLKFILLNAKHR